MCNNLELDSRIKEFHSIIKSCVFTDDKDNCIEKELALKKIISVIKSVKCNKATIYLVGNGGSSGVASHAMNDFLNMGKLKAMTLHDVALITCMSNDYGYEQVFSEPLKTLMNKDDLLIAISSSGQSKNIINAVNLAREKNCMVFTLSGFEKNNPLRQLGNINLWLSSSDYGFVEYGHAFILHNITDRLR